MIGVGVRLFGGSRRLKLLSHLGGTFELPENASAGAFAGTLTGIVDGSTLSLVDSAGGRVAVDGNAIERGATALDYEAVTAHPFTVRQAHPDYANSPLDTELSLTVENVLEVTLEALTGTFSKVEDSSVGATIGALSGVSSGSILSLSDDAAGKVALSGTNIVVGAAGIPTPGSYDFDVDETHPDGNNSPRTTTFTLTVTAAAPVIVERTSASNSSYGSSYTPFTGKTVAVGELLVCVVAAGNNACTLSTASTGWTELGEAGSAFNDRMAVYYKVANSTSETLVIASTSANYFAHALYRISGAANVSMTIATDANTDPDPPNHNPGVPRPYLWIAAASAAKASTAGPSGYSDFAALPTNAAASHLGVANKITSGTSSENPGAFTGAAPNRAAIATIACWA